VTSLRPPLSVPLALTGVTVLAQIAYPLAPDDRLGTLSVITVLAFAAASTSHAIAVRGWRWTGRLMLLVVAGAFAAEVVGVSTGFPFGHYSYSDRLGPLLAGVPLLVPFAWLMMAYPCLLLGRLLISTLGERRWLVTIFGTGLIAGGALAAWDVFLDPQMVAAHNWTWAHPHPGLPGVASVPLTNLGGWLLVAVLLMTAAEALLSHDGDVASSRPPAVVVPAVLLAWTWLGSVVGNAVFFDRPGVALWGGLLLGCFVAPYLVLVRARWHG
jgi:putative membrane protein